MKKEEQEKEERIKKLSETIIEFEIDENSNTITQKQKLCNAKLYVKLIHELINTCIDVIEQTHSCEMVLNRINQNKLTNILNKRAEIMYGIYLCFSISLPKLYLTETNLNLIKPIFEHAIHNSQIFNPVNYLDDFDNNTLQNLITFSVIKENEIIDGEWFLDEIIFSIPIRIKYENPILNSIKVLEKI